MARTYNNIPVPTPTKNTVPSSDIRDAVFAGSKMDEWATSDNKSYTDRLGKNRLTSSGMESQHNQQIIEHETEFNNQLANQDGEFRVQVTYQRNEFNDLLASSGYSWLKDYVNGPVTFTNRSQVTVYNGVAYRLAASTSLGFTTTGVNAASWANDSQYFVAIGDNDIRQQVQYQFGQWLPSTAAIMASTDTYSAIKTRGFYTANDGGDGLWRATGVTNFSRAGQHIITEAKIYNANGNEYKLSVGMGFIDPRANGAKPYETDSTTANILDLVSANTEDFVCVGEAVNGILSTVEDRYYPAPNNRESAPNTTAVVSIMYHGKTYRLGRKAIGLRSCSTHVGGGASIYVYPAPSQKFSVTGIRMNGLEHASAEILAKYNATKGGNSTGDFQSWSSISIDSLHISDLHIIGDHDSTKSEASCSANNGLMLLNPQYCMFDNLYVRGFQWPYYTDQINRTATSGPFQNSNVYSQVSGVPQFGNFYGCYFKNCRANSGRKGLVYSRTDWTTWEGGSICDDQLWGYEGDMVAPDYFLVQGGSAFKLTGCNFTVQHGGESTERWQPRLAVGYIGGNGVTIENNYLEHTPNFLHFGPLSVVHTTSGAIGGIKLDMIGAQYRPVSTWSYIKFSADAFPVYDANGNLQFPTGWVNNYTPFTGVNFMRMGAPTPDVGAFPNGGYDYKYGTHNIEYYNGLPDVDHFRGTKRAKEFLTPYGLLVSSGNVVHPLLSPAFGSNICIWIKDLTGNFDASKIIVWNAANIEGGSITDANTWMATGQTTIDFGNGYKLITMQNLRWAFDGLQNYSPSAAVYVQVDPATPIILKSVQAYTGGVPFFPSPLDYVPSANPSRIWGSQPSTAVNAVTGTRRIGGGIFRVGDIVAPWRRSNSSSNLVNPTTDDTTFPPNYSTKLIAGGCGLGGQMQKSFTVTVTAKDSTNNITTVNIDDPAMLPFLVAGQKIHLTGTTTGTTPVTEGDYRLLERVSYTSSSTNARFYTLEGFHGDIGKQLSVNNALVNTYSFVGSSIQAAGFGANWRTGVSGTATYNLYSDGTDTATAFISQANAGRLTYNNVNGMGHQFAGDVVLNNGLAFKGGVTTSGYAAIITATGTTENAGSYTFRGTSILPFFTNTTSIGSASMTFKDGFFQNAITVVSDADHKPVVDTLPDEVLDIFDNLQIKRWKYDWAIAAKGEDGARWHIGYIAQEVVQAFTLAGLNALDYAFVVWREWDDEPAEYTEVLTRQAVYSEEGQEVSPAEYESILSREAVVAGARWELVPHEMNFVLAACAQRKLKKIEDTISSAQ